MNKSSKIISLKRRLLVQSTWVAPVVSTITLPSHAMTSSVSTANDPPVIVTPNIFFIHEIGRNPDEILDIGLSGDIPTGLTFSWDVWSDGNPIPAVEPPNIPTSAPDNVGFLTTPNTGNLGDWQDNGPATPVANESNNYVRLTVTGPNGSCAIYYYLHELSLDDGEPATQHQVSFDGGSSWIQMDGDSASIPVPVLLCFS